MILPGPWPVRRWSYLGCNLGGGDLTWAVAWTEVIWVLPLVPLVTEPWAPPVALEGRWKKRLNCGAAEPTATRQQSTSRVRIAAGRWDGVIGT